jgi:glycosyltransferase involved in cell wall biosynthesis
MIDAADSTVTVIMPTYNQDKFICRAINCLKNQTFSNWELIIVNDGSTDLTYHLVQEFLEDERIKYLQHSTNKGLGASINDALDEAKGQYISYLPSDDVIYKEHLQTLLNTLQNNADATLAYSSFIHHYNRKCEGVLNNEWYQLVQVMHKKDLHRWKERKEIESDDLNQLFWNKIKGKHIHSNQLTCEWVDHPKQRHKIMQEPLGGINTFRSFYNVCVPLRFHTSKGNFMDEKTRYADYRKKTASRSQKNGLKILLVGELAYNAERILALEEQGHKLYGLWLREPYWYNYVGPLPFGNVQDIDYNNWEEEVKKIQPDLIYALLNFQAVPIAHEVLKANTGIPFVWHFKEGPMICREKGTWNELIELYTKADGRIYCSEEMKNWFEEFLKNNNDALNLVLDGDLPKKDWFNAERSPLLSEKDGAFHTVVPGRPIGLHPYNVKELADENIHLHFYGDFTHGQWLEWIEKTNRMAPGFLHIHPNVDQENWVTEFSQYDAGWLHFFQSENHGELARANWDDLNIPARLATLALSGLPMLQKNNDGHTVAIQSLVKKLNLGLFFNTMAELKQLLSDKKLMDGIRNNVWQQRQLFTFDDHVDELIDFFKSVIKQAEVKKGGESDILVLPMTA